MKKLFTKLALFTFISIILAMPLQAFAADCISKKDKQNYIITIVEEAFGEPTNPNNKITPKKDYQSIICCRVTETTENSGDKVTKTKLNSGTCGTCNTNKICDEVMVILSKGGTSMIEGYIASIYTWAASLVGLIAVTVIILSGIQIAASGGDTQAVDSAKSRIIKSISGLAVLFLSGLILYTINPNFFTAN